MSTDVTGTCRDFTVTPDIPVEERIAPGARLVARDMLSKFAVDFRADGASAVADVEMIESAMAYEPAARATLRLLLDYLRELLADEQGQACSDLLPAPLTNAARAVLCPHCYSMADVRAVVRLGRRHSPVRDPPARGSSRALRPACGGRRRNRAQPPP